MDGNALREGIFGLYTRRLGTVAELMVKRLVKLGKGRSLFHDLYNDVASKRVEVKFCVRKKSKTRITESTVLRCIEEASSEERMVSFENWRTREIRLQYRADKTPGFRRFCTTACSFQIVW